MRDERAQPDARRLPGCAPLCAAARTARTRLVVARRGPAGAPEAGQAPLREAVLGLLGLTATSALGAVLEASIGAYDADRLIAAAVGLGPGLAVLPAREYLRTRLSGTQFDRACWPCWPPRA